MRKYEQCFESEINKYRRLNVPLEEVDEKQIKD